MRLATRGLLRAFLLAGCLAGAGGAPAGACVLALQWERFIDAPGFDTRLAGLAFWGPQELAVGGWLRPPTGGFESFAVGFWRVAPGGEVKPLATFNRLDAGKPTPFEQVALTALDDVAVLGERLFGAAEGNMHSAVLLEIGPGGVLERGQVLPLEGNSMLLALLPLSSGNLLALGRQGRDALALVVTTRGEIERRFVHTLGHTARYLDALEEPGGRLLLLANGGSYDMLLRGPSQVVVRRLGADGTLAKELSFPGRHGALAALPDGRIALVYDRADSQAQEIRLQLYDPELRLLWEKPVTEAKEGFSRFRVAPSPDGTLLVAGGKEGWPYLAELDAAGERRWETWRADDPNLGQDYELLVRDRTVYVGTSNFTEAAGGKMVQQIRLTKYLCEGR